MIARLQKLHTLAPDLGGFLCTWAGLAPRMEPSSAEMLLVVPHVSKIIHVSPSRGRTCLCITVFTRVLTHK